MDSLKCEVSRKRLTGKAKALAMLIPWSLYNCFITLCNDYPKACQKEAKGVRPESVGENPLNGSTQPLSNKGDDIV